jgi:hypothetical protein
MECVGNARKSPTQIGELSGIRHLIELMQLTLNKTNESIHSMEQQMLTLRRHQEEHKAPTLAEMDTIMQKNMSPLEQRLEAQRLAAKATMPASVDPVNTILTSNTEMVKRVEQGVAELLTRANKEPKFNTQVGSVDSNLQSSSREYDMGEFRKDLKRLEETLATEVSYRVIDKLPDAMQQAMAIHDQHFQPIDPKASAAPQLLSLGQSPVPPLLLDNRSPPPTMGAPPPATVENKATEASQSSAALPPGDDVAMKGSQKDKGKRTGSVSMAADHDVDTSNIRLK